jgi:hypothetical protein
LDAQGLALPSRLAEREERGAFSEATMEGNFKALIAGDGTKLVVGFRGPATSIVDERAEREVVGLFDWSNDAKEKKPVVDEARTRELRDRMYRQLAESAELRIDAGTAPVQLHAATLEALQALGYGEVAE